MLEKIKEAQNNGIELQHVLQGSPRLKEFQYASLHTFHCAIAFLLSIIMSLIPAAEPLISKYAANTYGHV